MSSGKQGALSWSKVTMFCIKEYINEFPYGGHVLFFIVLTILLKKVAYVKHENIMNGLADIETFGDAVWGILISKIASVVLGGLTDFTIEYVTGNYRSSTSIKALRNILRAEGQHCCFIESGKTQYYIEQGSKGLSNMIKVIFVDMFSKVAYLVMDLLRIYYGNSSGYLFAALIVVFFAIVLHLICAVKMMRYKKEMNRTKGEAQKSMYETLSVHNIIKSYQEEDLHVQKFKARQDLWTNSYVYYKTLNAPIYIVQGVLFALAGFILVTYKYKNDSTIRGNNLRTLYSLIQDCNKTVSNVSSLCRKLFESLMDSQLVIYYIENISNDLYRKNHRKYYFYSRIEFKNISFRYENRVILDNVNFELYKGDKAVIYGRNGAGKTTLFNVIMRYNRYQGEILIDDISIADLDIDNYRSLITYVPQDTMLFDDTVLNNLTYGNSKSNNDIIEECKRIGIHEQIMRLSNGYNTVVGERGKNINGGLRQLIFYARAFLRDSHIYLFDEPTNNLDQKAGAMLINYLLSENFRSKTFLVICHDYNIVQMFPKIFLFENGSISLFNR